MEAQEPSCTIWEYSKFHGPEHFHSGGFDSFGFWGWKYLLLAELQPLLSLPQRDLAVL